MIVLGSPASGKTVLARRVSAELGMPCLSKDDIKEALFDALGVADRETSRRLSDASFAAQLRLAGTVLGAGLSCILEGNWRAAHAADVRAVIADTGSSVGQVWCRAQAQEIARRFAARTRHAGHMDSAVPLNEIKRFSEQPASFMELPGPRWTYDSDVPGTYVPLIDALKNWRL